MKKRLSILLLLASACGTPPVAVVSPTPPAPEPTPTPVPAPIPAPVPVTSASGWTDFAFAADAQKIYVSASGADTNDGLSEAKPVKTLAAGYAKLRVGKPDWLLLKRGDTWFEKFPSWNKSGRSKTEPVVVSSYGSGSERPTISADLIFFPVQSYTVNYVAIMGLHLTNKDRDPSSPTFKPLTKSTAGIFWLAHGEFLLIEDCLVDFHSDNITVEVGNMKDLRIRRNVITNSWPSLAGTQVPHSQGIYLDSPDGVLIEDNFIDANGYMKSVPGAVPTIFNHNVYSQIRTFNVTVRNNIFSRASATGIQMRAGGIADGNVFIQDPVSMTMGVVYGGDKPVPGGVTGEIKNNVYSEGNDIDNANPRGVALSLGNSKAIAVHDNFFSQTISPKHYHGSIEYDCGNGPLVGNPDLVSLVVKDNKSYKWAPFIKYSGSCGSKATELNNVSDAPSWTARSIAQYDAAFFEQARKQSRMNWNVKYTAPEVAKWFKAGFGK